MGSRAFIFWCFPLFLVIFHCSFFSSGSTLTVIPTLQITVPTVELERETLYG